MHSISFFAKYLSGAHAKSPCAYYTIKPRLLCSTLSFCETFPEMLLRESFRYGNLRACAGCAEHRSGVVHPSNDHPTATKRQQFYNYIVTLLRLLAAIKLQERQSGLALVHIHKKSNIILVQRYPRRLRDILHSD